MQPKPTIYQHGLNDTKFDQLHQVVVGAFVMFTSNVNMIAKGVVNGGTAMVTSVHTDNHSVVTIIGVQVIGNLTHIFLKRHNFPTQIYI